MLPRILLVLCCLGALPDAVAGPWSVDQLMHAMSLNRGGRASFTEKKFIALLDKPVESSGELVYRAPAHLEKHTLKPQPDSLVLDQDTLTIEREGQKRSLQLEDYPEVAAFVDSIRGTLAGDQAALERAYRMTLEGSPERWKLVLLPTVPEMLAQVVRISIEGAGVDLSSIEIQQADGDRSVMSITPERN